VLAMTSPGSAEIAGVDAVCNLHLNDTNPATHDPKIAARVNELARQLFAGDINFMRAWTAFIIEMRKGNPDAAADAPNLPNAADRESDAAVDLHCAAPLEARLEPKNGTVRLDIDDWRSYVNSTVVNLWTGQLNIQQAQELINKVRPEDRELA